MPTDHRRIAAPENTVPYQLFVNSKKSFKELLNTVINNKGIRADGRQSKEHRKVCK